LLRLQLRGEPALFWRGPKYGKGEINVANARTFGFFIGMDFDPHAIISGCIGEQQG